MSIRTPRTLALAVCLAISTIGAGAQAQTVGYNIRTGDVWVDSRLGEINDYGTRYRDPFINEMSNNYGAPRSFITDLLTQRRWAPADVYYACAIARALDRPCVDIVREYDRNPGQGWGAMAQRLGIKPGSAAFHNLKRGTVATYDRWGHPVAIDRNTRVDWSQHGPGHGKAMDHSRMKAGKGKQAAPARSAANGRPQAAPAKAHNGKASHKARGPGQPGNAKGNGKGKGKDG